MSSLSIAARACLRGDLGFCNEIFLHPKPLEDETGRLLLERVPELWGIDGRAVTGTHHFGVAEPLLLADLERQFGETSFARFWRSDLEVSAAFEDAFGVTPGGWMHEWASRYYRHPRFSRAGAGVAPWAGTILALIAALLMVRTTVARRGVG
jgi:hypothetical protein